MTTKKAKKKPQAFHSERARLITLFKALGVVEMLALDIVMESQAYESPEETTSKRANLIVREIDAALNIVAEMIREGE